jgi:ketosteroid isomerase-like protein
MQLLIKFTVALYFIFSTTPEIFGQTDEDRKALEKTTASIRAAFGRGDVPAIVALHHPDIVKTFSSNNKVNGRAALEKGLTETFKTTKLEFVDNQDESFLIHGDMAVEISVFTIKVIPKGGGEPTIARGRAMVVYVRYKESPTGWASIREMTQPL